MCFIIQPEEQYKKAKKARKDIVCYKVLNQDGRKLISPFLGTLYYVGRLKKSEVQVEANDTIEVGLHSYSELTKAQLKQWASHVGRGTQNVIYEAVIPKGSTYYLNPYYREYVSNQLKIVKKLK